jgi:hypothetical protein
MAGPRSPADARAWIRKAVAAERYSFAEPHFTQRLAERKVTLVDVLHVIRVARSVEPHMDPPKMGGTCWRVHGADADGRALGIGVEAYLDDDARWAFLVTVIVERTGR